MPSTSHSLDSARRRCTCCSRCRSADSGSSSRSAFKLGFSLLNVSTAAVKAPLVSLPMHQVTSPEAPWACEGCSVLASGAAPLSPSPPHPTRPKPARTATREIKYLSMALLLPRAVVRRSRGTPLRTKRDPFLFDRIPDLGGAKPRPGPAAGILDEKPKGWAHGPTPPPEKVGQLRGLWLGDLLRLQIHGHAAPPQGRHRPGFRHAADRSSLRLRRGPPRHRLPIPPPALRR